MQGGVKMKIEKDKLVQLRATHGIFPRFDDRLVEGKFLEDAPDKLGFIEFQVYGRKGFNSKYEEHKEPIYINLNKVGSVKILDKKTDE